MNFANELYLPPDEAGAGHPEDCCGGFQPGAGVFVVCKLPCQPPPDTFPGQPAVVVSTDHPVVVSGESVVVSCVVVVGGPHDEPDPHPEFLPIRFEFNTDVLAVAKASDDKVKLTTRCFEIFPIIVSSCAFFEGML